MVIKFLHSVKDTEYLFVLSEKTRVLTRTRVSFRSFFFFFCILHGYAIDPWEIRGRGDESCSRE